MESKVIQRIEGLKPTTASSIRKHEEGLVPSIIELNPLLIWEYYIAGDRFPITGNFKFGFSSKRLPLNEQVIRDINDTVYISDDLRSLVDNGEISPILIFYNNKFVPWSKIRISVGTDTNYVLLGSDLDDTTDTVTGLRFRGPGYQKKNKFGIPLYYPRDPNTGETDYNTETTQVYTVSESEFSDPDIHYNPPVYHIGDKIPNKPCYIAGTIGYPDGHVEEVEEITLDIKCISFPFNVYYTENGSIPENTRILMRFNTDGMLDMENGEYVISTDKDTIFIDYEKSNTGFSYHKTGVDYKYDINDFNCIFFKNGYLYTEAELELEGYDIISVDKGIDHSNDLLEYILVYDYTVNINSDHRNTREIEEAVAEEYIKSSDPAIQSFMHTMMDKFDFTFSELKPYAENLKDSLMTIMSYDNELMNQVYKDSSRITSRLLTGAQIKTLAKNGYYIFNSLAKIFDEDIQEYRLEHIRPMVFVNNLLWSHMQDISYKNNLCYIPVHFFKTTDSIEILFFKGINNESITANVEIEDGIISKACTTEILAKIPRYDLKIFTSVAPNNAEVKMTSIDEFDRVQYELGIDSLHNPKSKYVVMDSMWLDYPEQSTANEYIGEAVITEDEDTININSETSVDENTDAVLTLGIDNYGEAMTVIETISDFAERDEFVAVFGTMINDDGNVSNMLTIFDLAGNIVAQMPIENETEINQIDFTVDPIDPSTISLYDDNNNLIREVKVETIESDTVTIKIADDGYDYDGIRPLTFVSQNQFRYMGRTVPEEYTFNVMLSADFNYCHDKSRYMIFINGRKINQEHFKLIHADPKQPFDDVSIYFYHEMSRGDKLDIFYLPTFCSEFVLAETIPNNGRIRLDRSAFDYGLSKDLYLFFINGKKLYPSQMINVGDSELRIQSDIKGVNNLCIIQHVPSTGILSKLFKIFTSEWVRMLAKNYDIVNKLIGTKNISITDKDGDVFAQHLTEKEVLYEIARDYWLSTRVYEGDPFIYDYEDLEVEEKDLFGTKVYPLQTGSVEFDRVTDETEVLNEEKINAKYKENLQEINRSDDN